jgi:uncharacterized caspase-like protein
MTENRHALIVATSKYKDNRLAALEGPGQDAEALRSVLADAAIGGFTVKLAMNSRVDSLRRTLETFFMNRGRDDLLLVHFSGHGLKDDDGQLFLAAADTEIDRLLSTGIDAGWVNRLMNRCRSEKIALFLDCCFAGAFTSGMARRAGVDTAGVKDQFNGSGLFVIAASEAMQYSFEGGRQVGDLPEPSPFTKALVDGLRTGEADRNEDGVVSMNELFDYLEDRVRQTSPSQTPTKSAFNQVGDWAIARSTRVPSIRLLPEQLQRLIKSEDALDRFGALIDLRDIIEGPDRRLAEAGLQALARLTEDDSKRVAAAAKRLLEEETGRPRRPGRTARKPTPTPAEPVAPITPEAAPGPWRVVDADELPEGRMAATTSDAPAASPELDAAPTPDAPSPVAAEAMTSAEVAALAEPATPLEATPAPPSSVVSAPAAPVFTAPEAPRPAALATAESVEARPLQPRSEAAARAAETIAATRAGMATTGWSVRRSIARAAIATPIWLVIEDLMFLMSNTWIFDDASSGESHLGGFAELVLITTFWAIVLVPTVEKFVAAVRVPGGSAYRFVGGNRFAAAALLGAAVGLTIGFAVQLVLFEVVTFETIIFAAVGFLVAEALVGRRFSGQGEGRTATA